MENTVRFDLDTPKITDVKKVKSMLGVNKDTGQVGNVNVEDLVMWTAANVGDAVKIEGTVLPTLGSVNKSATVMGGANGKTLTGPGGPISISPNHVVTLFGNATSKVWIKVDDVELPKGQDANLGDWSGVKTYTWSVTGEQYVFYNGFAYAISENQTATGNDLPGISPKWIIKTTEVVQVTGQSVKASPSQKLFSDMTLVGNVSVVTWVSGSYINQNGGISLLDGYHRTLPILLPDGLRKLHLTGSIRYGEVQNNISFYDFSGAFLSGLQLENSTDEKVVDIPVGATSYTLSNSQIYGSISSFFSVSDVGKAVVTKEFQIDTTVIRWVEGYYLNSLGKATINSSWAISRYIYIPDNSFLLSLKVNAGSTLTVSSVAWYSSADESSYISSVTTTGPATYRKVGVIKPAGARFMRITSTSALIALAKVSINNIFQLFDNEELNSVIDTFKQVLPPACVGQYINGLGKISPSSGWTYSDYMPCKPGIIGSFSGTGQLTGSSVVNKISYYSAKNEESYISGVRLPNTGLVTWIDEIMEVPAGANYYRVCTSSTSSYNNLRISLKLSVWLSIIEKHVMISSSVSPVETVSRLVLPQYLDTVIGRNNDFFTDFSYIGANEDPETILVLGNDPVAPITRRGKALRHSPLLTSTNNSLTYTVRNRSLAIVDSKVLTLRPVSKSVGNGMEEVNLCVAGDSLVDNTYYPAEVYALLAQDNDYIINRIGTRGTDAAHEGRGGWAWSHYVNPLYETTEYQGKKNAFMSGNVLNFQAYVKNNFPTIIRKEIDIFVMNLGTNDVGQGMVLRTDAEIEVFMNNAKIFIDAFFSSDRGFPNAKFAIGLCSPGAPELSTSDRSGIIFRRSIMRFNKRVIELFDNGKYHANVTTVMHGAYIDRDNSYKYEMQPVNDYVTATVKVYTDGIHPQNFGYQQLARGTYGKIRAFLAGKL